LTDQILLEGLRFYGYHGIHPEERARGQRFLVDVVLDVSLEKAGRTDELGDTVNYSAVYQLTRSIVEGEPKDLVEAVAEEIASEVLTRFSDVKAIDVTVRKPEVTIRGAHLDAVGVRVRRSRPAVTGPQQPAIPKPRPRPLR
jgi:7,8-dihydroneopterin aldolase/epimerase/oxygenase